MAEVFGNINIDEILIIDSSVSYFQSSINALDMHISCFEMNILN